MPRISAASLRFQRVRVNIRRISSRSASRAALRAMSLSETFPAVWAPAGVATAVTESIPIPAGAATATGPETATAAAAGGGMTGGGGGRRRPVVERRRRLLKFLDDGRLRAEDDHPFDHVFELAHVARPLVFEKGARQVGRDAGKRLVVLH